MYVCKYVYIYLHVIMKTMCPPRYHHVPKCMSCHKAIVVITGRAHCILHVYYTHLASVRFEHCLCVVNRIYIKYAVVHNSKLLAYLFSVRLI